MKSYRAELPTQRRAQVIVKKIPKRIPLLARMLTSAQATFAAWRAQCGTPVGGDNLLRVGGVLYTLQTPPSALANGALRGRVYTHNGKGFRDIGGYHIGCNGGVLRCPAALRGVLYGAADATDDNHFTERKEI